MICYANNIGVWLRVSKVCDQLDRESWAGMLVPLCETFCRYLECGSLTCRAAMDKVWAAY